MAAASFSKLQPCKAEPFWIANVQVHTVVIDKDSVYIKVSIHRVTAAHRPESRSHALNHESAQRSDSLQTVSSTIRQRSNQMLEVETSNAISLTEYALGNIVGHKGHG